MSCIKPSYFQPKHLLRLYSNCIVNMDAMVHFSDYPTPFCVELTR